jgi:hypothetical protein
MTFASAGLLLALLAGPAAKAADVPGVTADSTKIGMFAPLTGQATNRRQGAVRRGGDLQGRQ